STWTREKGEPIRLSRIDSLFPPIGTTQVERVAAITATPEIDAWALHPFRSHTQCCACRKPISHLHRSQQRLRRAWDFLIARGLRTSRMLDGQPRDRGISQHLDARGHGAPGAARIRSLSAQDWGPIRGQHIEGGSVMSDSVNSGARLDRLPVSSFHYRIFW